MNADLRELYREVILEHSKRPRNLRVLAEGSRAEGYNPLCGDRVTVYAVTRGDRLYEVAFHGSACAVCVASASMMTEILSGKSRAEALETGERFRAFLLDAAAPSTDARLGPLMAFAGVRAFPSRIKCALLPWQTVEQVLSGGVVTVSTD